MYSHDGEEEEGATLFDGQSGDVGERHLDVDDVTLKEKPIERGDTSNESNNSNCDERNKMWDKRGTKEKPRPNETRMNQKVKKESNKKGPIELKQKELSTEIVGNETTMRLIDLDKLNKDKVLGASHHSLLPSCLKNDAYFRGGY